MRFPTRPAVIILACAALLSLCIPARSSAELYKVATGVYEMNTLLDQDAPPWTRLGNGAAILMSDGSLLINDNRSDDRVGYQTLLNRIQAENRLVLSARLKALSNFDGQGSVMEFSRPHLQVALHFFADRMELVEMAPSGRWRWLAAVSADFFNQFHEVKLIKGSSLEPGGEVVSVWLDGLLVASVLPKGGSRLEVGRVVIGAVSRPSMGASIWDWMRYDLDGLRKSLPGDSDSFGSLKAGFTSP